ncbi:MAG: dethiobiotin synthase [Rhodospirillaceae bacterium]|nr:dethiobiotin synthase [Rhodospirillaceae bacterium]
MTGTGDGVGKTHVCALLLRHWRKEERAVAAMKPILTGFDPADVQGSDAGRLLLAMHAPSDVQGLNLISPWRFRAALAPQLAAAREGTIIAYDKVVETCRSVIGMMPADGRLIIEAVGGACEPLDDRHTVMDWARDLAIPALLVAGSGRDGLSQALASLAAMAQYDVRPRAIVLNESLSNPVPLEEQREILAQHCSVGPILVSRRDATESDQAALAAAVDAAIV